MKKMGMRQKIICIVCVISIIMNIVLATNLKNQIQYETYMNEQYQHEREDKLYSVLNDIELDWDFSEMSENEINKALIHDADYCKIAINLINETTLSDDEGTFEFALKYTENYLNSLLRNKKLIGTEECNKALEEISTAFNSAVYRKDKESIKEYERVAKLYSGE